MGAAADQVWAMVSGLPSGEREHRRLMVLQAYVDDSGNEPQTPVFVLAGFIASYEQWAAFSDEWKAAISEPPGIAYFKMSQAERVQDEFSRSKGWDEGKRDALLLKLAGLIRKYAIFRVHSSIRHDDFGRLLKSIPTPQRNSVQDNPYFLLIHNLIQLCLTVNLRFNPHEKVDFFFDEHGSIGRDAVYHWENFTKLSSIKSGDREAPNLLADYAANKPTFRDEKCFMPLQAADLYAWQVRRNFAEQEQGKSIRRPLEIIQGLQM